MLLAYSGPESNWRFQLRRLTCYHYTTRAMCFRNSNQLLSSNFHSFQPQVPLRLPCYDLASVAEKPHQLTSIGSSHHSKCSNWFKHPNFRGLTGGVYRYLLHSHHSEIPMITCNSCLTISGFRNRLELRLNVW